MSLQLLLTLKAEWSHHNVFGCNGKSTGHSLSNYGCASDVIHVRSRKQAPGWSEEYEEKSLVTFNHEDVSINHKVSWLGAHCLLWTKTSKPKPIIAMTRQSDTLVNPVSMNPAWLNSDPIITIAELLWLNKRLDQKIQLEMAVSVLTTS